LIHLRLSAFICGFKFLLTNQPKVSPVLGIIPNLEFRLLNSDICSLAVLDRNHQDERDDSVIGVASLARHRAKVQNGLPPLGHTGNRWAGNGRQVEIAAK